MVKAVCRFNEETVKTMSKKFRNRTLSGAILLSLLVLAMGVSTIISAFSNEGVQKVLFIILGAIFTLFSVYPVISTVYTHRKNYRETIKAMELDKGELTLEFIIKEKNSFFFILAESSTTIAIFSGPACNKHQRHKYHH